MLSDAEFEQLKTFFERQRPKLIGNPNDVRAEIKKLDDAIDNEYLPFALQNGATNTESAIQITLQGRNFLARYIGETERPMPVIAGVTPEPIDPLQFKHVAVWTGHHEENEFTRAMKQTIPILAEDKDYRLYTNFELLIDEILQGNTCGVVGFSLDHLGRVESSIRHDLKNRPGWNHWKSEAAILPPCADFNKLPAMIAALKNMREGTYTKATETFDLGKELSGLLAHMYVTAAEEMVIIVDDSLNEVKAIARILEAWPKLKVFQWTGLADRPDKPTDINDQAIILLDDDLGKDSLNGSAITERLAKEGHKGPIVSITGGENPAYAKLHFQGKAAVGSSRQMALDFIKFMNKVLQQAEH